MSDPLTGPRVSPEAARALLAGSPVPSRCPAPGCDRARNDRQLACSGKCRAAASRRKREDTRAARDEEIRTLLEKALALLRGEGPR
jgi:hypothetical protein